ncbi:MAG: hypothetical protein A2481_04035 [Candidatus Yonathbacteria bacterium RIFOXYC2_FULL_47_9]|nr:MAG: hypothetical protein A2481_04035 [Candidatus Yonathbacteria bacterium RIFOXYC2_FULL_47_9]HAT68209.1 hypothetical protein [Candidatus Yonathbacteria bacterium]
MSDTTPECENTDQKNLVSCADNIVRYTICTPVDPDEAVRLSTVGKKHLDDGEASFVLIDLHQSTEFSSAARKIWVDFLQNEKIKKTAFFGGNVFVKTLATFVIAATGKKDIKFFNTEEEALAWFKE